MRKQIPQRRQIQSHLGDMSQGEKRESYQYPGTRYETGLNINPSNLVRIANAFSTDNKSGVPAENRAYRFFETRNLIKQGKER